MFIEIEQNNIMEFQGEQVILFGAGGRGSYVLEEFINRNIKVLAFCDNNKQIQGSDLCGYPIISSEELKKIFQYKYYYYKCI